jgi:hypothetical protein
VSLNVNPHPISSTRTVVNTEQNKAVVDRLANAEALSEVIVAAWLGINEGRCPVNTSWLPKEKDQDRVVYERLARIQERLTRYLATGTATDWQPERAPEAPQDGRVL